MDAAWASSLLSIPGISSPVVLRLVEDYVCHDGGGVPPAHYHCLDINGSSAFVLTSLHLFENFIESSHSAHSQNALSNCPTTDADEGWN